MISKEEVRELLKSTETYRIERTTSTGDMDKFQEAICAFSNDLPNSKKNGYLILGAYDNGTLSGLKVDDDLLKKSAQKRLEKVRYDYKPPKKKKKNLKDYVTILIMIIVLGGLVISLLQLVQIW